MPARELNLSTGWAMTAGHRFPLRSEADIQKLPPPPGQYDALQALWAQLQQADNNDDASVSSSTAGSAADDRSVSSDIYDFPDTPEAQQKRRRTQSPKRVTFGGDFLQASPQDSIFRSPSTGQPVALGAATSASSAAPRVLTFQPPPKIDPFASSTPSQSPFAKAAPATVSPSPILKRWEPPLAAKNAAAPPPAAATKVPPPHAVVASKYQALVTVDCCAPSVVSSTGSLIDASKVLILPPTSVLVSVLSSYSYDLLKNELIPRYMTFVEGASIRQPWAHCLDPNGMASFLSQSRVEKGLPVGSFILPLVDPAADDQSGISVYDFLLFLNVCDSPHIAVTGITAYHGVAFLQTIAFFVSLIIADPSWAGETLFNQQLAKFTSIIEAPGYTVRFNACNTDGAKWMHAIIRAVQESLRCIFDWARPPLRQVDVMVGGSPMAMADPKDLRETLDRIYHQLQYSISPSSIGTDAMLHTEGAQRGGAAFQHLFAPTATKSRLTDDANQGKTPRKSNQPLIARAPSCSMTFKEILPKIVPAPHISKRNLCVKFTCKDSDGCTPSGGRHRCGLGHLGVREINKLSYPDLEPIRAWFKKHEQYIVPTPAALSSAIFKE